MTRKRFTYFAVLTIAALALFFTGCSSGVDFVTSFPKPGLFQLSFSLDASFQGPYGGKTIHIALVRSSDGVVVARSSGTISSTRNPSFTFTTGPVIPKGISHEVHYWIDSNFGGGTVGECDPKAIDHQWSTEFPFPSNDIALTVSRNQGLTEDVCGTFN